MPSRFVILQHTVADGEHWDFMLEQGDVLLTWRLGREPIDVSTLPIVAHRIADHHKAFLEFEGRLSREAQVFRCTVCSRAYPIAEDGVIEMARWRRLP